MKYFILSIFILFTSQAFATECKREVKFTIMNEKGIVLVSNDFMYSASGVVGKENIVVLKYSVFYKSGLLYDANMARVYQLQTMLTQGSLEPIELSKISNIDNESITLGSIVYKDSNDHRKAIPFQMLIYVTVNSDCTLDFMTELMSIEVKSKNSDKNIVSSISKHLKMHTKEEEL
jgi:hypothetical protein